MSYAVLISTFLGSGRRGRHEPRNEGENSTASDTSVRDHHWHVEHSTFARDNTVSKKFVRVPTPDAITKNAYFTRQEASVKKQLADQAKKDRHMKKRPNATSAELSEKSRRKTVKSSKAMTSTELASANADYQAKASAALQKLATEESEHSDLAE